MYWRPGSVLWVRRGWLAVGLIGLIVGCADRPSEPVLTLPSSPVITPDRLVLNVPPDGSDVAPYPATGSFQLLAGDAVTGTWKVENPAIASIDARGGVAALATGTTLVWFELGHEGPRASASLEVVDRGGLGRVTLQ